MSAIQGMFLLFFISFTLFYLWKLYRTKAAESSSITRLADELSATHWNARSVGLKMAASALAAVGVVGISILWITLSRGKARSSWTLPALVGLFLFSAVTGALVAYCLALRDLVRERRSRGQRVHPVLRAYFSSGLVSVILWSVTGFVAGIGGILFYYAFLSPGVGPATG